jgi:hypothetical protein
LTITAAYRGLVEAGDPALEHEAYMAALLEMPFLDSGGGIAMELAAGDDPDPRETKFSIPFEMKWDAGTLRPVDGIVIFEDVPKGAIYLQFVVWIAAPPATCSRRAFGETLPPTRWNLFAISERATGLPLEGNGGKVFCTL